MSEIKLLPCPFCGGEAEITFFEYEDEEYKDCVHCGKCRVTLIGDTKEEAIKKWNTRKPMERIVERLEEQKEQSDRIYNELKDSFYLGMIQSSDNAIEIVKEEGGL